MTTTVEPTTPTTPPAAAAKIPTTPPRLRRRSAFLERMLPLTPTTTQNHPSVSLLRCRCNLMERFDQLAAAESSSSASSSSSAAVAVSSTSSSTTSSWSDEHVDSVCQSIGRSLLEPIALSAVEMQQSAEGCSLCLPPQMTEAQAILVWDQWMHSDDKSELKYGKWPLWLVGHLDLLMLHSWWAHWRLDAKWMPNHFTTVQQMTCTLRPSEYHQFRLQYWTEQHPDPTPVSTPKYDWHTSLVDDFHANLHTLVKGGCCDAEAAAAAEEYKEEAVVEEKKEEVMEDSKEKKEEEEDKSQETVMETTTESKKMEIHVHVHLDKDEKKKKKKRKLSASASESSSDEEMIKGEEATELVDEFAVGVEPRHGHVPYKTRLQWEHYFLAACDRCGLTVEQKEELFSQLMDVRHWNCC